jgi:hypothetical protein
MTSKTDQRIRGTATPIEGELWELAAQTSNDLAIAEAGSELERSILFAALESAVKLARAAAPAVEDAPRCVGNHFDCEVEGCKCSCHVPRGNPSDPDYQCDVLLAGEDAPRVESHWYLKAGEDATPRTPLRDLVTRWRRTVGENFGPTDRIIGIEMCADELEAALRAATLQPRED